MSNSVIIGPAAPSKSAIYAGVLSQIFADQDRRKQQKQQSQDLYFKQLADSIASVAQDPQEFSRRVGLLDENERQALMSRFPNLRFGSYETPAQKTDRIRNQQEQGDMTGANAPPPQARDFNEAFVASGAGVDLTKPAAIDQAIARNNRERGVYKADLPETLQKANLADATLGDSGLRTAERISTGQQLNAQQQATIPSENALRGAQTQSALAEVPLRGAQAKEAQATADFTAGPKSRETLSLIPKNQAETYRAEEEGNLAKSKGGIISAYGPDPETGAPNQQVTNWVNAVKGAAQKGVDAATVLKNIKDPALAKAVSNELVKPQNASTITTAKLTPAAQTAIKEIDPLIMQARTVLKAYEPYKTDNSVLGDVDRLDYALYRAGKKPPDGTPTAELANTQMLGVQAGARLLKGGSRAYPALQMAMQHAPNGLIDTKANIYDKSSKLIHQLVNVHNSQMGYSLASGSDTPPIGALKVFPNNALGKWDGQGWEAVP